MKKGKLLLINPWQTYEQSLESEFQSYIPYGLACIASIGVEQEFETVIIDCLEDETRITFDNYVRFGKTYDEVKKIIMEYMPDIVGISSTFSMFEQDATEIAELVKSISTSIITILGGVTATLEEIYSPLLLNSNVYDIMIRGEGENTFRELLQRYNFHTSKIDGLNEIKGIAYKSNNEVVITPNRRFISNLDELPSPALHLLNLEKIFNNKYYSRWRNNPIGKKSMPIFTSRGCPFNCCFCSVHSQVGYNHRKYSIDYVIDLMKKCITDFGVQHFHFEDDNLTLDKARAKKLFREVAKLNVTWDTPNGVRADKLDEEMLQIMKESGATSISIAAESGNETVRMNIIHKNLKSDSIVQAAEMSNKIGIPCIVFFVLGFPGETTDNIRETIQFAKKLTQEYNTINMMFIANPLPGTELNKLSQEKGYIVKPMTNSDYFVAIRANQSSIIKTEEFDKKIIFSILKDELDNDDYSVHNIAQPMFWANNNTANSRASQVFPKMSSRKVEWKWIGE